MAPIVSPQAWIEFYRDAVAKDSSSSIQPPTPSKGFLDDRDLEVKLEELGQENSILAFPGPQKGEVTILHHCFPIRGKNDSLTIVGFDGFSDWSGVVAIDGKALTANVKVHVTRRRLWLSSKMPSPKDFLEREKQESFGHLIGSDPIEGEGGLAESNGFYMIDKATLIKIFEGQPSKFSWKHPNEIGINLLVHLKTPDNDLGELTDDLYRFLLFLWGAQNRLFPYIKVEHPQGENVEIAKRAGEAKQKLFRFQVREMEKEKNAPKGPPEVQNKAEEVQDPSDSESVSALTMTDIIRNSVAIITKKRSFGSMMSVEAAQEPTGAEGANVDDLLEEADPPNRDLNHDDNDRDQDQKEPENPEEREWDELDELEDSDYNSDNDENGRGRAPDREREDEDPDDPSSSSSLLSSDSSSDESESSQGSDSSDPGSSSSYSTERRGRHRRGRGNRGRRPIRREGDGRQNNGTTSGQNLLLDALGGMAQIAEQLSAREENRRSISARLPEDQQRLIRLLSTSRWSREQPLPKLGKFMQTLNMDRNLSRCSGLIRSTLEDLNGGFSASGFAQFLAEGFSTANVQYRPGGFTVFMFKPEESLESPSTAEYKREIRQFFGNAELKDDELTYYAQKEFFMPKSVGDLQTQIRLAHKVMEKLTCKGSIGAQGYKMCLKILKENRQTAYNLQKRDAMFCTRFAFLVDVIQQTFFKKMKRIALKRNPFRTARSKGLHRYLRNSVHDALSAFSLGSMPPLTLPTSLTTVPQRSDPTDNPPSTSGAPDQQASPKWYKKNSNPVTEFKIPADKQFNDFFGRDHSENARNWPHFPHHARTGNARMCIRYQVVGKCDRGKDCALAHVRSNEFGDKREQILSRLNEIYGRS